jgi:hypothetical protein
MPLGMKSHGMAESLEGANYTRIIVRLLYLPVALGCVDILPTSRSQRRDVQSTRYSIEGRNLSNNKGMASNL